MNKITKTNEEWKKELSPEQYRVLREAGTEPAFTGEYTDLTKEGIYQCAACGNQLFASDNKFHSGCGWPSFDDIENSDAVETRPDTSHGMRIGKRLFALAVEGTLDMYFPMDPKIQQDYAIVLTL